MRTIKLRYATMTLVPGESIVSTFNDGATWGSYPHDTHHYAVIAHRCGYGDDLWRYAAEHDFCHHFVAEVLFRSKSQVLDAMARGIKVHPAWAAQEECLVQTFQCWLRANQRPIIDGIPWDNMKAEAKIILDGAVN